MKMRVAMLVSIGWLGTLVSAQAQSSLPTTVDTVRAVQGLFQARRTGGVIWGLIGGIYTTVGIAATVKGKQPTGTYGPDLTSEMSFAVAVPTLAFGLTKLLRFTRRREQQVLQQYQAGQPLPPVIQKKLRPRFFRP